MLWSRKERPQAPGLTCTGAMGPSATAPEQGVAYYAMRLERAQRVVWERSLHRNRAILTGHCPHGGSGAGQALHMHAERLRCRPSAKQAS